MHVQGRRCGGVPLRRLERSEHAGGVDEVDVHEVGRETLHELSQGWRVVTPHGRRNDMDATAPAFGRGQQVPDVLLRRRDVDVPGRRCVPHEAACVDLGATEPAPVDDHEDGDHDTALPGTRDVRHAARREQGSRCDSVRAAVGERRKQPCSCDWARRATTCNVDHS